MKRFSIFHLPALSFYSRPLYRDLALRWNGTCFAYLFLLLFLAWLPGMIRFQFWLTDVVDNKAPEALADFPEIRVQDGKASANVPQPYAMKEIEPGKPLAVIDTTGKIKSLDDTEAFLLLTRTELLARKSKAQTQVFKLKELGDFTVNREKIQGWLGTIKTWAAPGLFVVGWLGSFVYRVLQTLVYAVVGLLFAHLCRTELPYAALLRMAVAAVTPCILVDTLIGLAGVPAAIPGLLYFAGAMAYLYFGVRAAAQAEPGETAPLPV